MVRTMALGVSYRGAAAAVPQQHRSICHAPTTSCSGRPAGALLAPLRANARGGDNGPDFNERFNAFVQETSPKVENLVDDLKRSASRTAAKLDSEYSISDRANKAQRRVREEAVDIDQRFGIRRRLKTLSADFQKAWPIWSRRFEEYTSTPIGRFTVICGVLLLMTTTFFWKVVNVILLLWWLAIPIATLLIQKQAAEQVQQAQQAAAEEEERRRNPLGSFFRRAATGSRGGGGRTGSTGGGGNSSGPVIDAEWQDLDRK